MCFLCCICVVLYITIEYVLLILVNFVPGTPPRIDKRSINYTDLDVQLPDDVPVPFSFLNEQKGLQVSTIIMLILK